MDEFTRLISSSLDWFKMKSFVICFLYDIVLVDEILGVKLMSS